MTCDFLVTETQVDVPAFFEKKTFLQIEPMSQFDEFRKFLRRDVPLAMHTRLQLGGPAEFFAEPTSEAELIDMLKQSRSEGVPVRVIGSGTSILPGDEGVSGVVLSLAAPAFCEITVEDNRVTAGAGAKLGRVVTQSVAQGLSGIENLVGIPGTVGGALCGNVGTNSGDLGQWVESVRAVDFNANVFQLSRNEITFGYRTSSLDDVIILSVTLALDRDDTVELAKRLQKIWIVRKTQQPTGEQVSGYMFKNPATGNAAQELIERAGLKDARIGGAAVSSRNANFLLVEPECTVDDVKRLLRLVQDEVEARTETDLESAIEIW